MKIPNKIFPLLFVLGIIFSSDFAAAHEKDVLKFGVFPYKNPKAMIRLFMPIAQKIEKVSGKKVMVVSAPDFDSYIERAVSNEYDIIWPSIGSYITIHDQAGYEAIARGFPDFHGGVIVRKDSGITRLEELAGKKIAAVTDKGYIAFKFFEKRMAQLGLKRETHFSPLFLGKLDTVIYSVLNRTADAGIIRTDALATPAFDSLRDQLQILFTSDDVPQFPFAVHPSLDKELVNQITRVLLALDQDDPVGNEFLRKLHIQNIILATDSDYAESERLYKHYRSP